MNKLMLKKLISISFFHILSHQIFAADIIERGNLISSNITPALPGVTGQLVWLIKEGAMVKKGDRLAELDLGDTQEQIDTLQEEIKVIKEELTFLDILKQQAIDNVKDKIELIEMELQAAQYDLDQLNMGADQHERRSLEIQLELANLALERSTQDLESQKNLVSKSYASEQSLESLTIRHESRKTQVKSKELNLLALDKPPEAELLKELKAKVSRWKLEQDTLNENLARTIKGIELDIQKNNIDLEKKKSDVKIKKGLIQQNIVYAPTDGIVKISRFRDWTRAGRYFPIEIGKKVHARNKIADVMDPSQVQVQLNVHAVNLGAFQVGEQVKLSFPALNLKGIDGEIVYKSSLGMDLKDLFPIGEMDLKHAQTFFRVTIDVLESDERFLPGMSATVTLPSHYQD